MADTLRTLSVVLTSSIAGFQKGFKKAGGVVGGLESKFQKLNKSSTSVSIAAAAAVTGVAAVATAVAGALALAARETVQYSDAIGTMSERTGLSIENIQGLKFAAEQTGTTLERLANGARDLQKNLGQGTQETINAVQALGLSYERLRDASPDDQLRDVLNAISQVESPTQRTAIALRLLGEAGLQLVPLAGSMDELTQRARELGLVMSEDDVRAAKQLGESVSALQDVFGGLTRNVGAVITSNESLHVLVEGLADIFASLSASVFQNRDALSSLVSTGVLVLAKGLVLAADIAQVSLDVWDSLRLTWASLNNVALELSRSFWLVVRAQSAVAFNREGVRIASENIALIDAQIAANARSVDDIVQGNAAKTNAIQSFKTQLVELARNVEEAAGKERKMGAASRDLTRDLALLGAEEKRAAQEAAQAAKKFQGLLDQLSGAKAQAELDLLAKAVEKVGRDGVADLDALKKKLEQLVAQGGTIPEDSLLGQIFAEGVFDTFIEGLDEAQKGYQRFIDEADKNFAAQGIKDITASLTLTGLEARKQFEEIAEAGKKAGLSTKDIETALKGAGASGDQVRVAIENVVGETVDWGESLDVIANLVQALPGQLGEVGRAFAGVTAGVSGLLSGIDQIGKGTGIKGLLGDISGIGTAVSSVIGIANAVAPVIAGLFRSEGQEVNDLRDEWLKEQGGWLDLQKRLAAVTDQDLVKKIFDAKTVKEFKAATEEVLGLFDTQTEAQNELNAALEKYGFTDQIAQAKELEDQGAQLFKEWKLLTEGGLVPAEEAIAAMGPNLLEFVNTSRAAGQAIPEAMRPMIDQLIASGQLVDENGQAFGSAEEAGITFSQTMSEQFTKLIEKLDEWLSALSGASPDPITVPVTYEPTNQPPTGLPSGLTIPPNGGQLPELAEGAFVTMPTIAVVGESGPEGIFPLDRLEALLSRDLGAAAGETNVNLSVALNPLQTHETVEETIDFVVGRVESALAANLAELVADGKA